MRGEPLGCDRRHNRYWHIVSAVEGEPAGTVGQLYFESAQNNGALYLLASQDGLELLMGSLERRGAREGCLYNALLRHRAAILAGLPAKPLRWVNLGSGNALGACFP